MQASGEGLQISRLEKEISPGNALYLVPHNDCEQEDKCRQWKGQQKKSIFNLFTFEALGSFAAWGSL